MKLCFVGTNFDKFPIIDDLVEDMRDSGEEVVIMNWFANQNDEFVLEADMYIFVDIYPLRKDKPHCRLERGWDDDKVIDVINQMSEHPEESINESNTTDTVPEEKSPGVPWEDTPYQSAQEVKVVYVDKSDKDIQYIPIRKILGFYFTIDGKEVQLSAEDTAYMVRVFEMAKENGYTLEKVILDEESSSESESEDYSKD